MLDPGARRRTVIDPTRPEVTGDTPTRSSHAVQGRPLASGASRLRGDRLKIFDRTGRAVLRARHPGNRLLHQRAAEVVRAAVEHRDRTVVAELHPGALDVGDAAVQQDTRHRVDRAVLPPGRARPGDAGQVDGRAVMHERKTYELREAARTVLEFREYAEM